MTKATLALLLALSLTTLANARADQAATAAEASPPAAAVPPETAPDVPEQLPSRDEAAKFMKAEKTKPSANVRRVAITSCNVLFGMVTGADAQTQRGFGDSSQRMESRVKVSYELRGVEPAALQALTEQVCTDAASTLTAAGYDVVAAADVAAQPEFIKLHAGGKPAPYAYERGGTAYQTYAPAGQQIVDMTYLGRADTVFAGFKAMSTDGPMFIEARLAKAVDASPVHISVLIDFASAQGNTAKGFFGRMAGSDTAKVDAKLVMSAAGFMTMVPADRIDCSTGFCQGANDASLVARVTNKEALIGNASAVKDIFDAQTKLQKADELGGKLISGLAALAGTSTTMTDIQRNGVNVDPTAYASEARRLAREFTGMAAVMIKP
ncbi:hypothetical protein [Nevskia sp.]|uniref:hypothetical protein n=1 Tax=Nevskia sp. TaxID=1929292 RepID=UPI003F71EB4C